MPEVSFILAKRRHPWAAVVISTTRVDPKKGAVIMEEKKPTIALCMMAFNEEGVLARCLESVKGLTDELVVVDTGSEDKSIEVAKRYNAKVIEVTWRDDFAWARNQGLKEVKSDWVFILDPDETVALQDVSRIRDLTTKEGVMVWQIPTRNYTDNSFVSNFIPNKGEYEEERGFRGHVISIKTRLFRNNIGLEFEGAVHEMVDYQAHRMKLNGAKTSIPIHHYPGEKATRTGKTKAYFMIRICEKKVEKNPSDGQAWWEMGAIQHSLGLERSALKSMKRALSLGHKKPENLFVVAMILKNLNAKTESQRYFEKAICLMNPELTHVKEEYKKLSV